MSLPCKKLCKGSLCQTQLGVMNILRKYLCWDTLLLLMHLQLASQRQNASMNLHSLHDNILSCDYYIITLHYNPIHSTSLHLHPYCATPQNVWHTQGHIQCNRHTRLLHTRIKHALSITWFNDLLLEILFPSRDILLHAYNRTIQKHVVSHVLDLMSHCSTTNARHCGGNVSKHHVYVCLRASVHACMRTVRVCQSDQVWESTVCA